MEKLKSLNWIPTFVFTSSMCVGGAPLGNTKGVNETRLLKKKKKTEKKKTNLSTARAAVWHLNHFPVSADSDTTRSGTK